MLVRQAEKVRQRIVKPDEVRLEKKDVQAALQQLVQSFSPQCHQAEITRRAEHQVAAQAEVSVGHDLAADGGPRLLQMTARGLVFREEEDAGV